MEFKCDIQQFNMPSIQHVYTFIHLIPKETGNIKTNVFIVI